jgi:hypothetical protein
MSKKNWAEAKSDYAKKLLDPRWQKKRLGILNRDEWACRICNDKTKTLHVHHRVYIGSKEPWEVPDSALVTLCEDCHRDEGTEMSAQLEDLVRAAKWALFSGEIYELTFGLIGMQGSKVPPMFMQALSFAMSDPAGQELIIKHFLEGDHAW